MNEILSQSLGYAATALLALSLLVNNDIRFRWLNSFGSLAFVLYGFTLNAMPVILTNGILLGINIFRLIKIYNTHEDFDLAEFDSGNQLVKKYYSFHESDIQNFFPEFALEEGGNDLRFVVLRDLAFANIFIAHVTESGRAYVKINYTVPKYRDYKVGRFIFEKERKYLLSKGVRQIVYTKLKNKNHEQFLRVMGFEKMVIDNEECYCKTII